MSFSDQPASESAPVPSEGAVPRKRVFVDARWTRTDFPDGISRYGAGIIEALHRIRPVTMLIHDTRQLRLLPSGVPHRLINSPFSPRELWLSRTLHRLGAEVVFSPLQVIGGFRRRYALVLTLHDLIYYRDPRPPGFLPLPVRIAWWLFHHAWWPQRVLLNRADAVVTVSETTKHLIERHRLTARPVTVVPNAPGTGGSDGSVERDGEAPGVAETAGEVSSGSGTGERRELLYMGSFMPYKNVATLLAGMSRLPGYRLQLLSRIPPERERELREAVPEGVEVVFRNGVEEREYRRLLRGAAALVTASRDEGFGLPVIEAMNAGTPVVCSDIPIFREVSGGQAWFFDPESPAGFAAAVRRTENVESRDSVVAAARAHAAGFGWDSSARKLSELISRLVD
ncbi:Glycosyltransferase involved in cell wall bisynthesis [Actinopolyspora xinjiangensis]|uniref:Glycosyltransferase involved in cell wall bisynthesis n=1 Tax=Actinopolyspora xinjiangensis TaxID=405564 RepID=A0A1H0NY59_9ACTN|nr:glycosyltransferase family 1 protein [Actinopolyspora xinjiangensis]SDO97583.1 Glycosyltransferase involved in cell wall bisynthesis [Actinopolyspora xinjiangensis]